MVELHDFPASDGYRFRYRKYPAAGKPVARVVFIHGIQSHGGWYTRSCEQAASQNFETYFLDRRGSGLNTENRGDCPSFRRLIDDLKEFLQSLPKDSLKTFLVCISWGGKLGVGLQYRCPGLVDGLVLICPGIAYRVKTKFLTRLRIAFCKFVRPRKNFPIPLNDPKLFTSSEKWQTFLRDDPLALRDGTARLLSESVLLDIYLKRAKRHVTVPTLLMLAESDQIVDNAKVRRFVEKFPAVEKKVIEYAGAEHTLEFEPEECGYLRDLMGWLRNGSRGT